MEGDGGLRGRGVIRQVDVNDEVGEIGHGEVNGIADQQGARWNQGLAIPPKVRTRLEPAVIAAPLSLSATWAAPMRRGWVPNCSPALLGRALRQPTHGRPAGASGP